MTAPVDLVHSALAEIGEGAVAVTGASGWLGAAALDLLYEALGPAAPERVRAYASRERRWTVADGRAVTMRPLAALVDDPAPAAVLHFAYLTRERVEAEGPEAYVAANVAISATVLDAITAHRPRAVVYASSGAVYSSSGRPAADLVANPYGTLKRLDELAFSGVTGEVGATLAVPRIFNLAGPRMWKGTTFVLGDFIEAARAGGPVHVRSSAPVIRSFVGVDEVAALSLWAAATGRGGVFDTGGDPVELGDLATLVCRVFGLDESAVLRAAGPTTPEHRYVGVRSRWDALVSEAGLVTADLPALVRRTGPAAGGRPASR